MLRGRGVELAWGAFAVANLVAMLEWKGWETVPFHFIWVSLTLLYGFRVWPIRPMLGVLGLVALSTGALILLDISRNTTDWGELTEVPLMSAMFVAMVWHARRRQQALFEVEQIADDRARLLQSQERFLNDASHELRTPVAIARGQLELLERGGIRSTEIEIALDELARIERLVERLLLLAKAGQDDFVAFEPVELEPFLEDVFVRWSDVAPRPWRLGAIDVGTLRADPETLRIALDALLENAVKYTEPREAIELSARADGYMVEIAVADGGAGIPAQALDRIFERFARADAARTRDRGGVGLGLAIVDAIAKAHGGRCTVRSSEQGSTFVLRLPGFQARPAAGAAAPQRLVAR